LAIGISLAARIISLLVIKPYLLGEDAKETKNNYGNQGFLADIKCWYITQNRLDFSLFFFKIMLSHLY